MDSAQQQRAGEIIARMDRLPVWALEYIFIGVGELFTFFDIFNINVSFVQTAVTQMPLNGIQILLGLLSLFHKVLRLFE